MGFKEYLLVLLCAHLIGDFYLQTIRMAQRKESHIRGVLLHGACYWVAMLVVAIPVLTAQTALFACLAAAAHVVVDMLKLTFIALYKKKNEMTPKVENAVFLVDQCVHIVGIVLLAYAFAANHTLLVHDKIEKMIGVFGLSPVATLAWVFVLLLICKPANVMIAKWLAVYRPDSKDTDAQEQDKNAGRFIGILERVIIVIFIALGQYAATGLVLTAKSIARYDKISKDPAFAEYYLVGTLLSTLLAVLSALWYTYFVI